MLTTTRRITLATTLAAGLALAGAGTAVAAQPASAGKRLATVLEPGQEVGQFVGAEGASGTAAVRLVAGPGRVCVDIRTTGLDALALAHIHEGARGANGGVVVDLTELIKGDKAVGCVAADPAIVAEIAEDPSAYYVNTHEGLPGTPEFFSGIRGQL